MMCFGTLRMKSLRIARLLGATGRLPTVPHMKVVLPDGLVLYWKIDPLAFVEEAAS